MALFIYIDKPFFIFTYKKVFYIRFFFLNICLVNYNVILLLLSVWTKINER